MQSMRVFSGCAKRRSFACMGPAAAIGRTRTVLLGHCRSLSRHPPVALVDVGLSGPVQLKHSDVGAAAHARLTSSNTNRTVPITGDFMLTVFRKLKTDASAAPLHYAIIAAAV